MLGKSLVLLLLLASLAYCQNYPRIGTLEGHFSSNFADNIYFCINGDVLQGSGGEFVLFNANVSTDGRSAEGNFYQAGTFNCDAGGFNIQVTDEGFSGKYTCNRLHGSFNITGKKLSAFRPTDDQCALLYLDDDLSLQGRWTDVDSGDTLDICFKQSQSEDDLYTVHASYDTQNSGSYYYPNQGFLAAFHYLSGRIVKGTWYEDYNGGAWLVFIRNTGNVIIWKWTGLLGRKGATYIDYIQFNEAQYHSVTTWTGPVSTTNAQCDRNRRLDQFVLQNLAVVYPDNDNGFYYFLDSFISDPKYQGDIPSNNNIIIISAEEGDASTLVFSFALFLLLLVLC